MIPTDPRSIYRADTIDVVALVQVLWSYKYVVALVAGICAVGAVVLALTATPIYRGEVVVTPTPENGMGDGGSAMSRLGGLASLTGINLGSGSTGLGQEAQAVLESRHIIEEFIRRNGLLKDLYPNAPLPSLWLAVDRFRRSILSINSDDQKGTTTIAIDWTDPSVAATWANEFVALANDLIRTRALEDSNRNIDYLKEQLKRTNVVEYQRVLYNLIEVETQKVMVGNGRTEYAFTVVDPAVAPETRISPRRTLMVLTGGALGLILGVILALGHNAVRWHRVGSATVGVDRAPDARDQSGTG